MRRIVILGKGGSGKSTVVSELARRFRGRGQRVLQLGCDPKHDTALPHGLSHPLRTVMEEFLQQGGRMGPEHLLALVRTTPSGVDVLEAGGPDPGRGCAGRAVSIVLDLLDQAPEIYAAYDVVFYDVLGDVVCGGFATPLRDPHPADVILVASCDYLSLYAANNIARGLAALSSSSGARLVGVVANRVREPRDTSVVDAFARALGSGLLGAIPESDAFLLAELAERGTSQPIPLEGRVGQAYGALFDALAATDPARRLVPRPLEQPAIRALYRDYLGAS